MTDKTYRHWKPKTDSNGIVWCHLDVQDSSANILSAEVLDEFHELLGAYIEHPPTGLIILSDKSNGFIAGANIKEFTTIENEAQAMEMLARGHKVFDRLEALTCPTVSLIKGFCLGGGLELALACNYRIALESEKTRIGLPEVMLGIHPGFGGTMRLIRLIGPLKALPLILQGKTVDASEARRLGIVDYVVPDRHFLDAAPALIRKRPRIRRASKMESLPGKSVFRPLLAHYLRQQLKARVRQEHYPAPYALIDIWERAGGDDNSLLRAEISSVARLASHPASRNLVRVYLLQERLKSMGSGKDCNAEHLHVVGAGVMGGDIAAWCALQGMNVTLQDRKPEYIAPAIKRAFELFRGKLKKPARIRPVMDRLVPDIEAVHLEKADVIIEAIIEKAEAKIALFKQLEPRMKPEAILATNTSSIPLEVLGESLADPQRLVGIHFFNPVSRMQLVEIVHAANTGPEWIERAASFCRQIGRLPLPVKSSPGFLVNRILTPYLVETMLMLEEGVMPELIDRTALDFGMPMGPVELADTVGLDICLSVARNLGGETSIAIPDKLVQMVELGKLGKKTGSGYYQYKNGKPVKQKLEAIDAQSTDIEDRLILRIVNECVACLREEIVEDADLLDAGMIFGTGFAPFRGGPLNYARDRGYRVIVDRLVTLSEKHGSRFTPDEHWQALL